MAEPTAADVDALPPTQYLVMEVLAARHRLGEPFWTFPSRLAPAIGALEEAGLVWSDSAPTPRHVRVWLTDTGRAAATDTGYRSPLAGLLAAEQELARLRVQLAAGEASDGHHTHNELYEYRMLYNAHAAHGWLAAGIRVVKSWRHHDGEPCFGGGWFVVVAELPTGQVSNHYRAEHWDLFNVWAAEVAPAWDGHTPTEAADRLRAHLPEGGPLTEEENRA
jgi:hypothetical protein